jgi:tRNA/rRNA methyltransferase
VTSPTFTAPAIILVQPQLSENIGTTARAMMNCGLSDLRLVRPREDWLQERAIRAASGADPVLHGARVFERTEDAVADLTHVYATTGRNRYMVKRVVTPRLCAAEMRSNITDGRGCGVMFGPERTGLENDDIVLADTVLTVPLNPEHCSLNLAQAVLLVGYEWFQVAGDVSTEASMTKGDKGRPANKQELLFFFEHLERELDACGFLRLPDKRPTMVRNIRNLFQRAQMTEQEVRTMHGVVTELATLRKRRVEGGG